MGRPKGFKHSEETKRKLRAHRSRGRPKGFKHSEETKRKLRAHRHSEESKKKMSEAHKGQKAWNKGKKGLSGKAHPMYGKKHSAESRRKISEARARQVTTEEARRNMSKSKKGKNHPLYGKKHSAESIRKMSKTKISMYASGHVHGMKGKKHSPEARKKIRKKRWEQVIPTKDTKFELSIQALLREKEIKFEKHKPILGQPDIFIKPNLCVFLDGDFYHANPSKYPDDFILWRERISKSRERHIPAMTAKMIREKDEQVRQELITDGYKIISRWYSDWEKDREKFFQDILKAIKEARKQTSTKNS